MRTGGAMAAGVVLLAVGIGAGLCAAGLSAAEDDPADFVVAAKKDPLDEVKNRAVTPDKDGAVIALMRAGLPREMPDNYSLTPLFYANGRRLRSSVRVAKLREMFTDEWDGRLHWRKAVVKGANITHDSTFMEFESLELAPAPLDFEKIFSLCRADFKARCNASAPEAQKKVAGILKTGERVRAEDREKTFEMKIVDPEDLGKDVRGQIEEQMEQNLENLPVKDGPMEFRAGRDIEEPFLFWLSEGDPFTVYFCDRIGIGYSEQLSPLSSWAPKYEEIAPAFSMVSAAYRFDAHGKISAIEVFGPPLAVGVPARPAQFQLDK